MEQASDAKSKCQEMLDWLKETGRVIRTIVPILIPAVFVIGFIVLQIPLGVFYLASYVRNKGYQVDVIDAEVLELTNSQTIGRLKSGKFNILGISTTTRL